MPAVSLKLPEKSLDAQRKSKAAWNQEHCGTRADFFTIGYSGRTLVDFRAALIRADVATLIDTRYSPVSQHRPEFSKTNLKSALAAVGICYLSRPEWGVPRDVRALSVGKVTRVDIWNWYDNNVLPIVVKANLDHFLNSMDHPVAFMCTEYDPTECHRHRIFLALERLGFSGCEL